MTINFVGSLPERVVARRTLALTPAVRLWTIGLEGRSAMGAKENLDLVEQLQQAVRDRDFDRYGELVAEDAVWRMAGVPAGMGGVTTGREAIVDLVSRGTGGGGFEIKQQFGDDEHVCVVGKMTADRFPGNQYLRSADRPFSTYECIVYRIAGGKIAESTAYVNWLDPYVQVGLVDPSTLTP